MPEKLGSYRELVAWQKALDLVDHIYTYTANFPADERYGLAQQLRRAVVSIPSNIAEGSVRGTREFVHFIAIARGSLAEVETQLEIALRRAYISAEVSNALQQETNRLSRILMGLYQSLKKSQPH